MKIKFKKSKKHSGWEAGYYKGNGGVSSCIAAFGGTFFFCLKRMVQRLPYALKYEGLICRMIPFYYIPRLIKPIIAHYDGTGGVGVGWLGWLIKIKREK